MLQQISGENDGGYYYIEYEDHIASAFTASLGGLVSTCIENLVLTVSPKPHAAFSRFLCDYPVSSENPNQVRVGSLQSEENKDIGLSFTLEPLQEPQDQIVADIHYTYFDVILSKMVEGQTSITVARNTSDDAEKVPNQAVLDSVQRFSVGMAMAEAIKLANTNDFASAQQSLNSAMTTLKLAAPSPQVEYFQQELKEAAANLQSKQVFHGKGKKKMMARQHMLQKQRFNQCQNLYEEESELDMQAQQYLQKPKVSKASAASYIKNQAMAYFQ